MVLALAYSSDGKTLASASDDQTIRLWDANTGEEKQTLKGHTNWVQALAYSPDGKTLASASYDQTIRLWDRDTLMLFYEFDPAEVSEALKFIWQMGLNEEDFKFVHRVRKPALYPNKQGYYYSKDMDEFMPLLADPKPGEMQMDILVRWLKDRCAWQDEARKQACLQNQ